MGSVHRMTVQLTCTELCNERAFCFLTSRALPHRMWSHFWKVSTQGLLVAIVWPMIPQFICNCLFYWALYFNPIINIDLVVKEVRRLETHGP